MMRPFSAFHQGSNGNVLAHNNANAKIAHVTIIKADKQVFDSDAVKGTKITIHYQ